MVDRIVSEPLGGAHRDPRRRSAPQGSDHRGARRLLGARRRRAADAAPGQVPRHRLSRPHGTAASHLPFKGASRQYVRVAKAGEMIMRNARPPACGDRASRCRPRCFGRAVAGPLSQSARCRRSAAASTPQLVDEFGGAETGAARGLCRIGRPPRRGLFRSRQFRPGLSLHRPSIRRSRTPSRCPAATSTSRAS